MTSTLLSKSHGDGRVADAVVVAFPFALRFPYGHSLGRTGPSAVGPSTVHMHPLLP
jgi:hypothetical protein